MLDVLYYLLQITAITGLIAVSPLQPALQPQTHNSTREQIQTNSTTIEKFRTNLNTNWNFHYLFEKKPEEKEK